MSENVTPTARQRQFVVVLAGSTVEDAAKSVGISERTGYRWLTLPAVRAELRQLQDNALAEAALRLARAMTSAVATLERIMADDSANANARVGAARALLDNGIRYQEVLELTERVQQLESRLHDANDSKTN